jgi:hypothetical protein
MYILETLWTKPLTVCLHNGLSHTFHSVENAIDFMENEWPTRSGVHHAHALDVCRAARNRLISPEVAREAFMSACLEACMALLPTARLPTPRTTGAESAMRV